MCQSYYCTGLDGYGSRGFYSGPYSNNFYYGMASLNNLIRSFGGSGNRSSNNCRCCCNIDLSDRYNTSAADIGRMLKGNPAFKGNDGFGSLPMPGSNVPEYKLDNEPYKDVKIPEPYQVPIYDCNTPVTVHDTGVLSPDILSAGFMPPLANPMLSLFAGNTDFLNGMDPCQIAQLFSMWQNPQTSPQAVSQQGIGTNQNNSFNVTTQYTGTADTINSKLGGVLAGNGQVFLNAQAQYGINAGVLASICMHESANGISPLAKNKNNVGGVRIPGSNEFKTYSSVRDCIMDMARFLKSGYIDKGFTTISQIGQKYCSVNDPTDTTGENSIWGKAVSNYYQNNFA